MRLAFRAVVILTLLAFAPGLLEGWESPKAAVVRVAGLGLLAGVLASPDWRRRIHWQPLDAGVGAWLAVEVVTTVLSRAPRLSVFGDPQQHEGLLTSAALAGLYFGARLWLPRPDDIRGILNAWLAGAAIASAYALLQAAGMDPFAWIHVATLGGVQRPFGTMGHPNLLGVVTSAATAMAVAAAAAPGRSRALYAAAAAVLAAATLVTLSRAAWLGLAAGCVVSLALLASTRTAGRLSPRAALLGAGIAAAGVVAIALSPLGGPLVARLRDLATPLAGSGRARLDIWRAAWAAWQARPLIGHGPDAFDVVFARFQPAGFWLLEWNHIATHAHSIYLHALATRGVLGAAAGLFAAATLATAARAAWRAADGARATLAAMMGALVAIAACGATGALGVGGALAVALIAAMTANLAVPPPEAHEARATGAPRPGAQEARATGAPRPRAAARRVRRPGSSPWRRAQVAGGVVAALALVVSANDLTALAATGEARRWIDRIGAPDGARARARFTAITQRCRVAATLAPWDDASPRTLCEMLLIGASRLPEPLTTVRAAEGAAREAVRRVPLRAANHRRLADALAFEVVLGEDDRRAACEAEFERAASLAPYDGFVLLEWARSRLAWNDPARAFEPAQRLAALYPDRGMAQEVLGETWLALADSSRARVVLKRALAGAWDEELPARARAGRLLAALEATR